MIITPVQMRAYFVRLRAFGSDNSKPVDLFDRFCYYDEVPLRVIEK